MAAGPTQTQLDRLKLLQKELADADASFQAIVDKELKSLNDKRRKKKLDPIRILTKEEFDKQQN